MCTAGSSGVQDRYSFRFALRYALTIYVWFLLFLDSQSIIIFSPLQWNISHCNFHPPPQEKKKTKKKRKGKETTTSCVLGPKCSLPCINSMALPQRDTSTCCDRDSIKHCWSQPNQCTVLMRNRGGTMAWSGLARGRNLFVSLSLSQRVPFTTMSSHGVLTALF